MHAAGLVGFGATVPLQWSNYCDDVLAASFRVTLPEASGTPRCDDSSGPSTLTVYPFQEPVR